MKKLIIILIVALISCNGNVQDPPITDTIYKNNELRYNIPNNDREAFGGSPDVWSAGLPVTDSLGVTRFWLFTEVDIQRMNERADNNLTDR